MVSFGCVMLPNMAKNQVERIAWIDGRIRQGFYPSRSEAAEHFEVSVKTIERDLEFLRDRLGAPLEYDRKRKGYYYSDEGFFLPRIFLSEGEAMALFLAHQFGSQWKDTPLGPAGKRAWAKLQELFPDEMQLPLGMFTDTVTVIDNRVASHSRHWITLAEATATLHRVSMVYRVPGYEYGMERVVHPYKLLHHRGAWYLIAFDEYRDDIRMFALSRIEAVEISEKTFHLGNFSLSDYIDPSFGVHIEQEWFTVRVVAESPAADVIREHLPSGSSETVLDVEAGITEFKFETNQTEELKHWLLQWGEHVEVVEPQSLREELARIGEFYIERYR